MRKLSRTLLVSVFFLLLGVFPIIFAGAVKGPSLSTFSTGPYQTNTQVQMQVLPNDPTHIYVTASITSINGPLPGSSETAGFAFYYNGVLYTGHVTTYSTNGQTSETITFTVPLKGHGTYECDMVVINNDNNQIIGDPKAMLNW